ncbi:hypothetical protein DUT91_17135 [Phyllobacterium salinisoli]|uniref:TRAP C4-dicarboxylate transport system permease DctM subunit domain-containing protein n=1 Tax=Phyllobacterium salinisoli TaxID=1899321 RepID=A0A368JZQ0_9HYPH|nr:TRAP transporter large permease subunit [Phyllobacterium salinisoli]RCS22607.1 hypothetical protein DUT91_17135 [Phyllobacterium salinisoli]
MSEGQSPWRDVLVALVFLAIGFFIDATVLIILLTPIFLPLVRQARVTLHLA